MDDSSFVLVFDGLEIGASVLIGNAIFEGVGLGRKFLLGMRSVSLWWGRSIRSRGGLVGGGRWCGAIDGCGGSPRGSGSFWDPDVIPMVVVSISIGGRHSGGDANQCKQCKVLLKS